MKKKKEDEKKSKCVNFKIAKIVQKKTKIVYMSHRYVSLAI